MSANASIPNLSNVEQYSRARRLHTPGKFAAAAQCSLRLMRKSSAKENAMFHLTNAMLIGAFVVILAIVIAVSAFLESRRKKPAPFRDYFGPEYDRDLLQQGAFSETEDWLADRHARFAPFRLRDPAANERR
jgi:hypothetical protein